MNKREAESTACHIETHHMLMGGDMFSDVTLSLIEQELKDAYNKGYEQAVRTTQGDLKYKGYPHE